MSPIPFMTFGTVELSASAHPNQMQLKGVLLRLDEPSTKAPHGSKGHRILVSSALAKKRVGTLVNMGLNYAPSLQEHAQRRKVGVITKAWIDGKDLKVEATIWKRDFPEAERDLKQAGLGMSMEIGDVRVEDQNATIWTLSDFCFLGATVLEKTSAAYFRTHAIAAARLKERNNMVTKKKKVITTTAADLKELVAASSAELAEAAIRRIVKPLSRQMDSIATRLDAIEASTLDAVDDEEAAEDEEACDHTFKASGKCSKCGEMKAAKKKPAADDDDDDDDDEDDEDDMDSEIDKGDLEDLGPEEDVDDDEPGSLNKEAKNKGRKTTSEDKTGKTVSSARLKASLEREKETRVALNAALSTIKATKREMRRLREQMEAASEQMGRRSVALPQEIVSLLTKGGVSVKELQASGEKLTVEQVDALLANINGLPPVKRIELKTLLAHNGLMDEGRVNR